MIGEVIRPLTGLPLTVGKKFSASSKARGEEYFQANRVTIQRGSSSEVTAVVEGSEPYQVSMKWRGDKLSLLCDCPHFLDHGALCKHLWAAILAADEQGHLADAVADIENRPVLPGLEDIPARIETARPAPVSPPITRPVRIAAWKNQLSRIAQAAPTLQGGAGWPVRSEVVYLLDPRRSAFSSNLMLTTASRERGKDGQWRHAPKPRAIARARIATLPLAEDREILSLLAGGDPAPSYGYHAYERDLNSFGLPRLIAQSLLPKALRTGRCFVAWEKNDSDNPPLQWDEGEPWRFVLEVSGRPRQGWQLTGSFRRGEQRMAVKEPLLASRAGFLVTREWVAPLAEEESFPWIELLREQGAIVVPEADREEFLANLLSSPALPALDLPQEWAYEEISPVPRPCLKIHGPRTNGNAHQRMKAELSFDYAGRVVQERTASQGIYDAAKRQLIRRDRASEQASTARLEELGLRFAAKNWGQIAAWDLAPTKLPRVVRALTELGWLVTAEGRVFRQPGRSSASVASGVDWFELHGEVEYEGAKAGLPQLLAALKRGERMVILDDGSYGLLPEEWLRRFGQVAMMGEAGEDHIRFRSSQVGLLDALLAAQPAVNCDQAFRHVRRELAQFHSIGAAEQPAGFQGVLRGYQREGLGWMHFLRQFSFGGCLADDMGVGKTAQVLALLESRRELRAAGKLDAPSLAVVPKSLIFNWKQEAQRFTPQLRVLDYTGIDRDRSELATHDLVLTTYGTLRRDAALFQEMVFDYIILDEAQAIKNEKTESAKAARLLKGNYRLALSGTPIENHLGELWSLFEFLNPGMLGASGAFQLLSASKSGLDEAGGRVLSHALRPFVLRRTKEQVAKELPAKSEQTIYCEMEPGQRKLYNELRDHYRTALLPKVGAQGLGKAGIQVLEALLRLRQAACHPGLVNRTMMKDPSAKLEMLMEQLRDVMEEGHKALVFSQFTGLLSILRASLEAEKMDYEYLDGKTVDRQARVERFQQDAGCRLFLISLKAGGLGLNLTAAEYVFILDPWWNPAVEAQAVDRAHRIGQARQVFAYRLIARDTVEEKVLQLQETKRRLADAIIGAENSSIRDLTREDIELLLS